MSVSEDEVTAFLDQCCRAGVMVADEGEDAALAWHYAQEEAVSSYDHIGQLPPLTSSTALASEAAATTTLQPSLLPREGA